jgi:YVTN family beta-propeller protein
LNVPGAGLVVIWSWSDTVQGLVGSQAYVNGLSFGWTMPGPERGSHCRDRSEPVNKRPAIMITVALVLVVSAGALAYAFTSGGSGAKSISQSGSGGHSHASGGLVTIGTLPTVLVGSGPLVAVLDPATHTVYVANQGDNTLSVIDARTCHARDTVGCGRKPLTVAAGKGPVAIAIDDATHTLYVSDSDEVSVINAATCNAEDFSGCRQTPITLDAGEGQTGVAIDPRTDTLYLADTGPDGDGSGHAVWVVNGATCNATDTSGCRQKLATVRVGRSPMGLALDSANETLYVADAPENEVSMINVATCHAGHIAGCATTAPTAAVGEFPVTVAVDPSTDTVYVANGNEPTVSVINGATCNSIETSGCRRRPVTATVLGGPDGLAIDEATHTLFVSDNGPGSNALRENGISVVDAATCNSRITSGCNEPTPTVITGANPGGATVDQVTDTLYVPTGGNTVQVVNGATCNATAVTGCGQTTPATLAGTGPDSAAIDPATSTVYVGDWSGGDGGPWTISVLDAAACNTTDSAGCTPHPPTITVQSNPVGVAVDPGTDTIYATDSGYVVNGNYTSGDTVSVIDGASCNASVTSGCSRRAPTVTVGDGPSGVAVDEATDTIYVANSGQETVSVIDGKTCNALDTSGCGQSPRTVTLGGQAPVAVAVDQATDTVYALSPGAPAVVSVIDGATCNATVTSGCGKVPPTVVVGDDDVSDGSLAVDQATDTVYVVNTDDDTVSVINGATCNADDTSGCGRTPAHVKVGRAEFNFGGVAVDQVTDLVYVSNTLDDTESDRI